EYRHVPQALLAASASQRLGGAPSFFVLQDESPRPGAFFFGGALTLLAVAGFSIGINYAGSYAGKVAIWSGEPASRGANSSPGVAKSSPFESRWRAMLERLGICQPLAWQMKPADADRAMNSAAGAARRCPEGGGGIKGARKEW
ncbi:MAG: hypothetical protein WBW14_17565, partial [Candidatus Acidiferrum sp.]